MFLVDHLFFDKIYVHSLGHLIDPPGKNIDTPKKFLVRLIETLY